jgi:hypothetical protein
MSGRSAGTRWSRFDNKSDDIDEPLRPWTGMMVVMNWSDERWEETISSPDWAPRVVAELQRLGKEGDRSLARVKLLEVSLETDTDGVPFLLAVYEHAMWEERTGLRRRLNRVPMSVYDGMSPEGSLAIEIAMFEIAEPLGSYYDLLVEDSSGVWWWGDGYPELAEPLNEPWYQNLARASWTTTRNPMTVALQGQPVCGSLAAAEVRTSSGPIATLSIEPVHCIRRKRHDGLHISAMHKIDLPGVNWEMLAWA